VRGGQHVEERGVRIIREIDALGWSLPPGEHLAARKALHRLAQSQPEALIRRRRYTSSERLLISSASVLATRIRGIGTGASPGQDHGEPIGAGKRRKQHADAAKASFHPMRDVRNTPSDWRAQALSEVRESLRSRTRLLRIGLHDVVLGRARTRIHRAVMDYRSIGPKLSNAWRGMLHSSEVDPGIVSRRLALLQAPEEVEKKITCAVTVINAAMEMNTCSAEDAGGI